MFAKKRFIEQARPLDTNNGKVRLKKESRGANCDNRKDLNWELHQRKLKNNGVKTEFLTVHVIRILHP